MSKGPFKMKYGNSAFPFKGTPTSSPAKFIGMGLSKMIRSSARQFGQTGVGQAIGRVAGSGALGIGGMVASNMLGGGSGEAAAQDGAGHTHDEAGNAIPLTKKSSPAKYGLLLGSSTLATLSRPVGVAVPKPNVVKGKSFDDNGEEKEKKTKKIKGPGIKIPAYTRKI
jgi:hypothetical protein